MPFFLNDTGMLGIYNPHCANIAGQENKKFDQSVRCKYCAIAGGGNILGGSLVAMDKINWDVMMMM